MTDPVIITKLEILEENQKEILKILTGNGDVGLTERVRNIENQRVAAEKVRTNRRKLLYVALGVLGLDPLLNIAQKIMLALSTGGP